MNKPALADLFGRTWSSRQAHPLEGRLRSTRPDPSLFMVLDVASGLADPSTLYAERIRTIAAQGTGTVYQSVAVVALRVLERVLWYERQVSEAAMSLGQRERLTIMVSTLDATIQSLRETLTQQGEQMLQLSARQQFGQRERYWWFALTEAIEALEEGAEWMADVVSGQPRGCASRTLCSVVVRLLHRHYYELLNEAEQWMSGHQ